jgi:hypothetical protein
MKYLSLGKLVRLSKALAFYVIASVSSLQAQTQPSKGPQSPEVWGPRLPEVPPEKNECVKKCNDAFEIELKKCLESEGPARADCERPYREQHRACFLACPQ